jgi:hypothetical protein
MLTRISFCLIIIALSLWGCAEEITDNNEAKVLKCLTSGAWHITYFYETDRVETSNYIDHVFTFGASDVLTVAYGKDTFSGSWKLLDNNSSNDLLNDLHMVIAFESTLKLYDLSGDWYIQEVTDTKVTLIDTHNGKGSTDKLTFEKK